MVGTLRFAHPTFATLQILATNFCSTCRVGKGAKRRAHRGANAWWARCALPTLRLPPYKFLPQIFVQRVGWAKEQSDVPTAVPMLGGHALLCPPYKFLPQIFVQGIGQSTAFPSRKQNIAPPPCPNKPATITLALKQHSGDNSLQASEFQVFMEHLGQFILNHWGLWLTFISLLIMVFINETLMQKKRGKSLTPAMAVDLINNENAVVVDLRDIDTFRSGHIINAIQASDNDFGKQRLQKYKESPVILVCARGLQSAQLATKLREQGFTKPMFLSGGMAAWIDTGLPTVKGK
jgi:rhodanese-related sulfurtransferase